MRRAILVVLALALIAPTASAQGRFPRRWIAAGVGALLSGAAATVYAIHFENDIGGCSRVSCVVPVTVTAGALIGFMIGNEMDKVHGLRYAHAPPLSIRGVEISLSVVPNDIELGADRVFVTGTDGMEIVRAGPRLERLGLRARGLRGIGPVTADRARTSVLVGTAVGLYRFPLTGDAAGTIARPGEISALSADAGLMAIGLGPSFEITRVAETIVPMGEPIEEDVRVVDLAWQGQDILWALTEDRLAGYRVAADGTTEALGEFPLPAIGRRVVIQDTVAVIAAGSGGVYALSVADPGSPRELANWSGARFAYDVTIIGDLVYIAAGPEGLYLTRLEGTSLTPVGLSREAGFVAAVETDGESVYLLDRTGGRLRRIEPHGRQ